MLAKQAEFRVFPWARLRRDPSPIAGYIALVSLNPGSNYVRLKGPGNARLTWILSSIMDLLGNSAAAFLQPTPRSSLEPSLFRHRIATSPTMLPILHPNLSNSLRLSLTRRGMVVIFAFAILTGGRGNKQCYAQTDSLADHTPIRRLLSVHCSGCHNSTEKKGGLDLTTRESALLGGDSGPALVEGALDASLVWQRVETDEMPPKHPMNADEKNALRVWLEANAPWTGGPLDPAEFTSELRAGYDWWALQPLKKEVPPPLDESNPIDAFVSAKRSPLGLKPSPPADRRTLARRIAIDLIGLPPSFEEVQRLVDDPSTNAVELYIDRLLADPAYGQRWARYWLDAIRFGESHGFERDQLRSNSWRYRDWVVNALNQDMSYREFCRMQIAGDALESVHPEGVIATGMLVAGSYDQVGQTQQSAAMRAVVRQDELEDYVSVVGQTFLGLTINCSRCHDHKFDPIPQREYYAMCAALAGTHHGERTISADEVAKSANSILSRIDERSKELKQQIDAIEVPVRERLMAEKQVAVEHTAIPTPLAQWEFDDLRDSMGGMDLELREGAKLVDGHLQLTGLGHAVSIAIPSRIREKTLEVWVKLSNLTQRGGAAIGLESDNGAQFDSIVYGELEPTKWMAGSNGFVRTDSFHAEHGESDNQQWIHFALVYQADGLIRAYRNGTPYGNSIRKSELVSYEPAKSRVLFGLRHSPVDKSRILECEIERASLYDRALSDEEVAASSGSHVKYVSIAEIERSLEPSVLAMLNDLRFEWGQLIDQRRRVQDSKIYSVVSQAPEPTFVLDRGNPGSPLQEVLPSGIAAIVGMQPDLSVDKSSSDLQRRLALANWITDNRNPLFARVIVNRIWQFHFGIGIVDTPNDFGFNGGRPTHPELLDWLANDLIEHGWSLKHLHRLITTSKTYRQSSRIQSSNMATDSGNRLLWRKSPMRLDAETLRDNMLELSGQLDRSLDGPGIYDFTLFINNSHFYAMRDPIGKSFQRRTLYRTWVRSARSNFLDVFDCPDPSTKTPQRAATTTPLQSLSLLNNSFVLRTADAWARKTRIQVGYSLEGQIKYLFQQAFYREPMADELVACVEMAKVHGLNSVCRVLLNSNELLYVD